MPYTLLTIHGFRGFSTVQTLKLAIPDGKMPGSGLTIILGANNAGKSTITEALRALGSNREPSFTEGRRNKVAGDRVEIKLATDDGAVKTIRTVSGGGSETATAWEGTHRHDMKIFSLPSRRYFSPYFNKNSLTRESYTQNDILPNSRATSDEKAAHRLFEVQKNRTEFDGLLERVVSPVPQWAIEQSDQGQYYLKFQTGDASHSSEGMGEGLVSLMLIIDALYDSKYGDTIVIDEPELSLHPAFQRKLAVLLREYSATRQIVCSTHSPYFVDLEATVNGGQIARVYVSDGSKIAQLSGDSRNAIAGVSRNLNNPHIMGLDAREVFFLEDKIILVEGQEDKVIYPKIAEQLHITLSGAFYGWGVGGAGNMEAIAQILHDLGFKKVFGILDGNKKSEATALQTKFPAYSFDVIATNDVRTKDAVLAKDMVVGLTDSSGHLDTSKNLPDLTRS